MRTASERAATERPPSATAAGSREAAEQSEPSLLAVLTPVLVNFVIPLVLFYGLRAAGTQTWLALLISGLVPAMRLAVTVAVRGRTDVFDVFVVTLLLLGAAGALIGGGPRFLLLKDASVSALVGLWVLGTLVARQPFALQLSRQWYGPAARVRRQNAYDESPRFRRGLRTLTVLWGAGAMAGGVVGTAVAATLPVDSVPVVSRASALVVTVVVATASTVLSRCYRRRYGLALFGRVPALRADGHRSVSSEVCSAGIAPGVDPRSVPSGLASKTRRHRPETFPGGDQSTEGGPP